MGQLTDDELLEYIDKQKRLRRPGIIDMSSTIVYSENSGECDRGELRVRNVTKCEKTNRIRYIYTVDTDIITGDEIIWGPAYLLMIKKFDPDKIVLRDMSKFLAALEHGANEYVKDCTDKEICEQFPEFVRMLKVIYHEVVARGVKPVAFVRRLHFNPREPITDGMLQDYVRRARVLPLPGGDEVAMRDTDAETARDAILHAANLLLVNKMPPGEIDLHDMDLSLAYFERDVAYFEPKCPDKAKCERYLHCVQLLREIYRELMNRGVKPMPFEHKD